jgi:hypothetical protein
MIEESVNYGNPHVLRIVGTFTSTVEVSAEDIDNLVSAAFEGGITYWCCQAKPYVDTWPNEVEYVSQCLSRGYDIALYDAEDVCDDGSPSEYILTLPAMIRGIEKYCDLHGVSFSDLREDYDGEAADCIVQYALFSKLVYG